MKRRGVCLSVFLAALTVVWSYPAFCDERELRRELRALVNHEDEGFLLTEIQRIQPIQAIRRLARFQQTQNRVGGELCCCLPGQVMNADEIPLPVDDIGVLEAAVFLAKQRRLNHDALARLGFPVVFPLLPLAGAPPTAAPPNMTLHIDWSVPAAFLDALGDGEVTMDEATMIAQMPANREMLRSVCARRRGTGPWVTGQTLKYFIWKAGSPDPLDRIWRWLSPMNDFGYAELAANPVAYGQLIAGLEVHHQDIVDLALSRVAPFLPPDRKTDETFVLTVGCLNSDWATPDISGANVLRLKSGWEDLVQRVAGAVYRRQLFEHCHHRAGHTPQTTDDLLCAGMEGDERYEIFHEMIAYTGLEGAVDYVSNQSAPVDDSSSIMEGADLIDRYVVEVLEGSHKGSRLPIFEQGRRPDGPLRAVGRHMAKMVVERDGPQAITALLEQGFVAFFERALEIDSDNGGELFNQELIFAIRDLNTRLDR